MYDCVYKNKIYLYISIYLCLLVYMYCCSPVRREAVQKAFGVPCDMLFETFDSVPIGSGCVGQVGEEFVIIYCLLEMAMGFENTLAGWLRNHVQISHWPRLAAGRTSLFAVVI